MTFNETTLECTCQKCNHSWRARTSTIPRKCSKCTSISWNDSGKQYSVLIARSCGMEEKGYRMVFCVLEDIESPDIISEETFYIQPEDLNKYLNKCHYPPGSAIVIIGSTEIGEDRNLVLKDVKLIYLHEKSFRSYVSLNCVYNRKSYYNKKPL